MSAPKQNQFWKLRSKHGRDLIFSSPTLLWEACCEYLEATDKRKWYTTEYVGKDGNEKHTPTDTPYTLSGLFVFLDISKDTWQLYKKREDFIAIITRVEQIIYTQKFEGAAVGAFNASIIARDLGLKDSTDITSAGENINQGINVKIIRPKADPEPQILNKGSKISGKTPNSKNKV